MIENQIFIYERSESESSNPSLSDKSIRKT